MVERLASYGWERWPQRMTLDGSQYLCRWCAKPLTGQQTSYCSYECRKEIEVRCLWDSLKSAIYDRDGGVCKKCGVNFEDLEEFFKWYYTLFKKYSSNTPNDKNYIYGVQYGSVAAKQDWPWPDNLRRDLGYGRDHLYEISHIKALSEGGDPVDPQNLETLCLPCHKKHTATLRKRLKESAKKEKR